MVLKRAVERWPNQMDLLMVLIEYLLKNNDTGGMLPYLAKASAISPNAPRVRELVQQYVR